MTAAQDLTIPSSKVSGAASNMDSLSPTENKNDLFGNSSEVSEDDEDSDDDSGFGNALQDLIPGVKVKVLKVTAPAKVDRDLISKVIEEIIDDEDEEEDIKETDSDLESVGSEEEIIDKSDIEQNSIEMDADRGIRDGVEQSQIALKVVVSGLVQNMSSNSRNKDFQRVPARLERKGRLSFTFTIEEDDKQTSGGSKQSPPNRSPKLQGQRSIDHLMLDLAKFIGRGKIPMKVRLAKSHHLVPICFFILMICYLFLKNLQVLKDVRELFTLTLNQARNPQPLSKSTTFNRIEIPASQDPLNGD